MATIRERRSILRFTREPVDDRKIETILEAGRWAPSFGNSQPWEFVVVKDATLRRKMSTIAAGVTIAQKGIESAPVVIVTCVDPRKDSSHFIEAGAVATHNMALAAHSLGLASYWIGIYSGKSTNGSAEEKVKRLLGVPQRHRVIAFLPIGVPAYHIVKERKALNEIVHYDTWKPIKG